jgi:hypothetical protein
MTPSGRVKQALPVQGSYAPVVGDFDGNGTDDIFWYGTGLAADSVWYFRADRTHRSVAVTEDLITGVPLSGDFDGDGRDDVFFYGPGSASDDLWWSQGTSSWTVTHVSVSGRYHPAVHDATGDGRADITWFAPGPPGSSRWSFSTNRAHTSTSLPAKASTGTPYAGDFDGDGLEDVALIAPGSASDAVWYSTPLGADVRSLTLTGSYAVATGHMDRPALPVADPEDVLLVSNAADHLLRGRTDRTFSSTQVG